ncbi:caspase recruitment domain-containing protein 9-like isoform X2 [Misgurnus anguillicaudatus]|uniref:caspase recruitment domain-containing protein 9-like isoform X2 n=1 Tax=Misgurnus anguillicaudatus TaxID=75329 RepID=UPI003CCF2044
MSDDPGRFNLEDEDECWARLEDYRMLLIKTIEPSRITPYLRQCKVLSSEDEEQIYNDPNLVIRRRKVGVLLDILQRTGLKGYEAFLESLELDYPDLYRKITGKEPARVFSVLIDTAGECGLTQFLMNEVSRLQKLIHEERKAKLEIERLKHSLMNAESDSKIQRKKTITLKNAMEQRPSQEMIWQLQRENDLLTARIQELESASKAQTPAHEKLDEQSLADFKQQNQAQYQKLVNDLYNIRKDLHDTQELRDKFQEEKDELALMCTMLKKDSKMYCDRMEDILKQLEEVIKERDRAIATREEYHLESSKNLQEKDNYRKQIREMGERYDELQVQLFHAQGEVLGLQAKLRKQNNLLHLNSEESPLMSSFEPSMFQKTVSSEEDIPNNCILKGRYNIYNGRKRAVRTKRFTVKENVQCIMDNTTGSDTDGL